MVILHHFIGTLHPELFIERHRIFIGDEVYRDVLLSAGKLMGSLHQPGGDSLTFVVPVNTQVGDIKPVAEIGEPEKRAYKKAVIIPGGQAD